MLAHAIDNGRFEARFSKETQHNTLLFVFVCSLIGASSVLPSPTHFYFPGN